MPSSQPFFYIPLLFSTLALADLVPTSPGPGEIYRSGSNCSLSWDPDTSGLWTNVTIDLMSGSNTNMTHVTNVVSGLDGTDTSLSPYSWTCPEVDPYSAIYFYQFTNGEDLQGSKWTTRFTIASPSGDRVPPENSTQPNGDPIPWGTGHLAEGDQDRDDSDDETKQDSEDDQTDSGEEHADATSHARKDSGETGDGKSRDQLPVSTKKDHPTRVPSAPPQITSPPVKPVPTTLAPPPRKDRSTASSSSVRAQSTGPCQCSGTSFGNRLSGMQPSLVSGSVKVHVGLNIVPPLLVALFILF